MEVHNPFALRIWALGLRVEIWDDMGENGWGWRSTGFSSAKEQTDHAKTIIASSPDVRVCMDKLAGILFIKEDPNHPHSSWKLELWSKIEEEPRHFEVTRVTTSQENIYRMMFDICRQLVGYLSLFNIPQTSTQAQDMLRLVVRHFGQTSGDREPHHVTICMID